MSSDSVEKPSRKEINANLSASTPPATDRPSKSSRKRFNHVDLIDQLDYSSYGQGSTHSFTCLRSFGLPITNAPLFFAHLVFGDLICHPPVLNHNPSRIAFHHDGPFDALAPSRNRHHGLKAPMRAFNEEEAIIAAAAAPDDSIASALKHARKISESPYAAASLARPTSPATHDSYRPSIKTLAEAWGRADPEPFEEFSAGGYTGPTSESSPTGQNYSSGASGDDTVTSRATDLDLGMFEQHLFCLVIGSYSVTPVPCV